MRTTLGAIRDVIDSGGAEAALQAFGTWYFVCAPESAFNVPDGPKETLRIDMAAFAASQRGEFHPTIPVFLPRQRAASPYSFISIGRTENCDICLPDASISKLHALLRERDGQIAIQDAGSANGTRIGGEDAPLRNEGYARALISGDEVTLGSIRLHFMNLAGVEALLARLA